MKKYTLNSYGWSMEAIGKSLTNEEVLKTEELIKEKGSEFIWEVRFDIDDLFEMLNKFHSYNEFLGNKKPLQINWSLTSVSLQGSIIPLG